MDEFIFNHPAVSMWNDTITASVGGVELYNDPERCSAFAEQYHLATHVRKGALPMFLAACMDDDMVPPLLLTELTAACREQCVSCELHLFPCGGRGFAACVPHQMGPFPPGDDAKKTCLLSRAEETGSRQMQDKSRVSEAVHRQTRENGVQYKGNQEAQKPSASQQNP